MIGLVDRFASWVGSVVNRHFKSIVALVLIGWGLVALGLLPLPSIELPLWLRVGVTFAILAAIGGYLLASLYIDAPEPDWTYLIEFNVADETTPRIHRVTDAVLADLEVVGGRLESARGGDVFACRWFNGDPENPVAHVTWQDVPSDSELLGVKPSSIEDEIVSLRDTYEETHGRHQWVLDHLYMVIRRLDKRRTESQNAVLEEHVTPSMAEDSLGDVVDDVIPASVRPDSFATQVGDGRADEALDELEEDLEGPDATTVGSEPTAAADGGKPDE